jgi:hypothetical protein
MTSATEGSQSPMQPAWPVDGAETQLWRGPARVTGQTRHRPTEVVVTWRPELAVRYRQRADDAEGLSLLFGPDPAEPALSPADSGTVPVTPTDGTHQGRIPRLTWGNDTAVHRLRVHLTNFPDVLLPDPLASDGARWRGTVTVAGGPWQLRIDRRHEAGELIKTVRAELTYASTHIAELTRLDGAALSSKELSSALNCIHHLCSFARAAWVAPMLPVGYDAHDQQVWWEATPRFCTAGLGRGISWLDPHDGQGFAEAAGRWLELWQDPLWQEILRLAVIYCLEANRQGQADPSFLEVKYTMAQAALELLAWAILHQDPTTSADTQPWQDGGPYAAENNLRALLEATEIPRSVPDELPAVQRFVADSAQWTDAAPVVPWLRNQVAHPKRRPGGAGLPLAVVQQGWRLACWYVELVLLWRLGYHGDISCSRLTPGVWAGQTQPVPWART